MVSGVICPLGDLGTDVHARLARIVERMNAAKANIRGFSKAAATDYFVGLFFLAQGIGAAGVSRPVANMVVSNVPGTPDEVYLAGARLAGVHPLNVLTLRMGLSVTLVSCGGRLDIGLIANRSALPDPGRIADHCREAFAALRHPPAPARARRPGRKETPGAAAAARGPRAALATKRTGGAIARARKP
jgi:hypothetical protein